MIPTIDLLPQALKDDELLVLIADLVDKHIIGVKEIKSISFPHPSEIEEGDNIIINTPKHSYHIFFTKNDIHYTSDKREVLNIKFQDTYNPHDLCSIIRESFYNKDVSISHDDVDLNKIYVVNKEVGYCRPSYTSTSKIEIEVYEKGKTLCDLEDTLLIVDELAKKIFDFSIYEDEKALMAWWNVYIDPIVGTYNCVSNLVKLLSVDVSIIEWYKTSYLVPFKFIINLPESTYDDLLGDPYQNLKIREFVDLVLLIKNERSWLAQIGNSLCKKPEPWDVFWWDRHMWDDVEGVNYKGVKICIKVVYQFEVYVPTYDAEYEVFEDDTIFIGDDSNIVNISSAWMGPWDKRSWRELLSILGYTGLYYRSVITNQVPLIPYVKPSDLYPSDDLLPNDTIYPGASFRRILSRDGNSVCFLKNNGFKTAGGQWILSGGASLNNALILPGGGRASQTISYSIREDSLFTLRGKIKGTGELSIQIKIDGPGVPSLYSRLEGWDPNEYGVRIHKDAIVFEETIETLQRIPLEYDTISEIIIESIQGNLELLNIELGTNLTEYPFINDTGSDLVNTEEGYNHTVTCYGNCGFELGPIFPFGYTRITLDINSSFQNLTLVELDRFDNVIREEELSVGISTDYRFDRIYHNMDAFKLLFYSSLDSNTVQSTTKYENLSIESIDLSL